MRLIHLTLSLLGAVELAQGRGVSSVECGSLNGVSCEDGQCCSTYGYCGSSSDYCGSACQSGFGCCTDDSGNTGSKVSSAKASPSGALKVSPNGQCGNGYTCLGSDDGNCCSEYSYCGDTDAYCGKGCQSSFGTCNSLPSGYIQPSPSKSASRSSSSLGRSPSPSRTNSSPSRSPTSSRPRTTESSSSRPLRSSSSRTYSKVTSTSITTSSCSSSSSRATSSHASSSSSSSLSSVTSSVSSSSSSSSSAACTPTNLVKNPGFEFSGDQLVWQISGNGDTQATATVETNDPSGCHSGNGCVLFTDHLDLDTSTYTLQQTITGITPGSFLDASLFIMQNAPDNFTIWSVQMTLDNTFNVFQGGGVSAFGGGVVTNTPWTQESSPALYQAPGDTVTVTITVQNSDEFGLSTVGIDDVFVGVTCNPPRGNKK